MLLPEVSLEIVTARTRTQRCSLLIPLWALTEMASIALHWGLAWGHISQADSGIMAIAWVALFAVILTRGLIVVSGEEQSEWETNNLRIATARTRELDKELHIGYQ